MYGRLGQFSQDVPTVYGQRTVYGVATVHGVPGVYGVGSGRCTPSGCLSVSAPCQSLVILLGFVAWSPVGLPWRDEAHPGHEARVSPHLMPGQGPPPQAQTELYFWRSTTPALLDRGRSLRSRDAAVPYGTLPTVPYRKVRYRRGSASGIP